jgi:hypothetical protein
MILTYNYDYNFDPWLILDYDFHKAKFYLKGANNGILHNLSILLRYK